MKVAIFDDVVAARNETFHIDGLDVEVFPHADDAAQIVTTGGFDVVFMDFAMGAGRKDGAAATRDLRAAGFTGKIVATSSDPVANQAMRTAGANEQLDKKALLRSYLVHLAGGQPA